MKHRLRELRDERGWTQAEVADKAGMSKSYYADIERGDKQINQNRMGSIATAFGIPASSLIELEGKENDILMYERYLKLPEADREIIQTLVERLSDG